MTVQEFYKEWRKQEGVSSDPRGDWPLRFAVAYHERMVSTLEQALEMLRRERKGEVWCWQDDGEDYPESLGCPTLVQPSVIRRWVAAEAKLAELSGESRQ